MCVVVWLSSFFLKGAKEGERRRFLSVALQSNARRENGKKKNASKSISPPCTCTLASRAAPNFSTAASKSPACCWLVLMREKERIEGIQRERER